MKIYKQGKRYFYINTVLIISIIIISILICIYCLDFVLGKYILIVLIAGVGFGTIFSLRKDYKSTLVIDPEKIIITSRGKQYNVHYLDIVSIQYQGIAHSLLYDCLILNSGRDGKIYVDAAYENYTDLWKEIINNTQNRKSNTVVADSVIKRLNKNQ